jgi:hypothetical protein
VTSPFSLPISPFVGSSFQHSDSSARARLASVGQSPHCRARIFGARSVARALPARFFAAHHLRTSIFTCICARLGACACLPTWWPEARRRCPGFLHAKLPKPCGLRGCARFDERGLTHFANAIGSARRQPATLFFAAWLNGSEHESRRRSSAQKRDCNPRYQGWRASVTRAMGRGEPTRVGCMSHRLWRSS